MNKNLKFNIIGIILTIIISIIFIDLFGYKYLLLLFLLSIIWNILVTIIKSKRINGSDSYKLILKSLFTTNIFLPFTIYGCYCSPNYGIDGKTNKLKPIDSLDKACLEHDLIMISTIEEFNKGLLTKKEYKKIRNIADFNFIKSVLYSNHHTTHLYIMFLILGFLIRIVLRSLFK